MSDIISNTSKLDSYMTQIIKALKEGGYDPYKQLIGYVKFEDPTFITRQGNARKLIKELAFDEVKEWVKEHTDKNTTLTF